MKARRVILGLFVFLLIAALLWMLYRFSPSAKVDTAQVLLPTPVPSLSPEESQSGGEGQVQLVSVTPDTVQAVIGTLSRADSYARTLVFESFWQGGSSARSIDVWVRGDNARFTVKQKNQSKNVLLLGSELWIWYADSGEVYRGLASERAADEYQALLTYEDVLRLDKEAISEAGYTDFAGENCIYVCYTDGELGYESYVWISENTGLLMGSETYEGDRLVYRVSSSPADISTPDDEVFVHP